MKYSIYLDTRNGSINYGKTKGGDDAIVLQPFHNYGACSSQFHNYMAMVKLIGKSVERAERIGQPSEMLAVLYECAKNAIVEGDVLDQVIPLAQAAFQILCELEKAAGLRDLEGRWRFNRLDKMIAKGTRMRKSEEPMPGSISAMSDIEREEIRTRWRAAGWAPKF
jgi:hypothetical protein